MTAPLLTTKLYIPPPRQKFVTRPRLLQQLDEGLHQGKFLTLVSAPAGYGKSVLISEWFGRMGDRERPTARVSWLSFDENDNDPGRFLTYLVAALQRLHVGIGQSLKNLLGNPQLPPIETLLTILINDITEAGQAISTVQDLGGGSPEFQVLALDDYHKIALPFIHEAIQFLLDHQPPKFHLVLITREDPPLYIPKMRVSGEITEIRAQDLRFTIEEAILYLNQAMQLDLDREWIQILETRTEGWIAGLQLAALSLQGRRDVSSFLEDFRGDHRYVIDYLVDEVLRLQPYEVRQFLLDTSILDRFCASLCEVVTDQEDGQEILAQLEQSNLFVIPLDDRREWYRYHHLFSDALQTELSDDRRATLHKKAAGWFETNGFTTEAVEHALASGEFDLAALVIERALANPQTWSAVQLAMLEGWLQALPASQLESRPRLAISASRALYLAGKLEQSAQLMEEGERTLSTAAPGKPDVLQLLSQARSYRAAVFAMGGEIAQARALITQSLATSIWQMTMSRPAPTIHLG